MATLYTTLHTHDSNAAAYHDLAAQCDRRGDADGAAAYRLKERDERTALAAVARKLTAIRGTDTLHA